MRRVSGFTLVELLVVISIIIVLLALLSPALDKAVYEAEMLQCAAKLSAIGRSAQMYTVDFRRSYPWRANVHARGWKPNVMQVSTDAKSNERPVLRRALGSLNAMLNDPFLGEVDFEGSVLNSNIEADYNLWFGFGYRGQKGMYKLGGRVEWNGARHPWIASDIVTINAATSPPSALANHPDHDEKMKMRVMQDEGARGGISIGPAAWTQYTLSRWELPIDVGDRGPLDLHFAADDGSVQRLDGIIVGDERMVRTPATADPTQFTAADQYIPR